MPSLVVGAGMVAKGSATGGEGTVRVLVAAGMIAPQVGPGAFLLLLSPDHWTIMTWPGNLLTAVRRA